MRRYDPPKYNNRADGKNIIIGQVNFAFFLRVTREN